MQHFAFISGNDMFSIGCDIYHVHTVWLYSAEGGLHEPVNSTC